MGAGALAVARVKKEKAPLRTTPVKIDTGLVRKARTIAEDRGVDLSDYLSGVVRGAIDRDWDRILKRLVEREGGAG